MALRSITSQEDALAQRSKSPGKGFFGGVSDTPPWATGGSPGVLVQVFVMSGSGGYAPGGASSSSQTESDAKFKELVADVKDKREAVTTQLEQRERPLAPKAKPM